MTGASTERFPRGERLRHREAVKAGPGDIVVAAGVTGGVGSIAVQSAKHLSANVIGPASERNHGWLTDHGMVPVRYGEGEAVRTQAAADGPVMAFIDTYGHGYVDLALELGMMNERITRSSTSLLRPGTGSRRRVTDGYRGVTPAAQSLILGP